DGQEQKADDEVTVLRDERGDGLEDIALDEVHFRNMTEETIDVVFDDQLLQLVVRIGTERPRFGLRDRVVVRSARGWESFEAVESVDAPREVLWLEHRAELGPAHDAEAAEEAAFDDGALDGHCDVEGLVQRKKPF